MDQEECGNNEGHRDKESDRREAAVVGEKVRMSDRMKLTQNHDSLEKTWTIDHSYLRTDQQLAAEKTTKGCC